MLITVPCERDVFIALGARAAGIRLSARAGSYAINNSPNSADTKLIQTFGRSSYRRLLGFYRKYSDELLEAQTEIAKHDVIYPVMRLIDMYFWGLGHQTE